MAASARTEGLQQGLRSGVAVVQRGCDGLCHGDGMALLRVCHTCLIRQGWEHPLLRWPPQQWWRGGAGGTAEAAAARLQLADVIGAKVGQLRV